jgi:hypothetical protein
MQLINFINNLKKDNSMIRDFIEEYLPLIGGGLYGKMFQTIYVVNKDDYDFAMKMRAYIMKEDDGIPIRIDIAESVAFDGGESEAVTPGKIIILHCYTKGFILPDRMERCTIKFEKCAN